MAGRLFRKEPRRSMVIADNHRAPASLGPIDKWSFYALLIYFAVQPFNDSLHRMVLVGSYIDFAWALILLAFALGYLLSGHGRVFLGFELKVVLIWLAYIAFRYALPASEDLHSDSASVKLYALRWLVQTVPLFILFAVRGCSTKELNAILSIMVLMMPYAILTAYRDRDIISVSEAQEYAGEGHGVSYNTFVPYTTFSLFASIYLIQALKSSVAKLLICCILGGIAVFIFINPSRQSVLFIVSSALIVIAITRSLKMMLLMPLIGLLVAMAIYNLDLTETVVSRFFSPQLIESHRSDLMADGLNRIGGPWGWVFGEGLAIDLQTDVNPHNNYIFSVMRIGCIGMALMFLPFWRAFIKSIAISVKHGKDLWFDRNLSAFITITLFFTLFHSFFGCPHLDALNAPIVWLGLSLWVSFHRGIIGNLNDYHGETAGMNRGSPDCVSCSPRCGVAFAPRTHSRPDVAGESHLM